MVEIRQGMCSGCPWNIGEEWTERAFNLGCLPSTGEAIALARREGKAWACHSEPDKICCGYAAYVDPNRNVELYRDEHHVDVNETPTP